MHSTYFREPEEYGGKINLNGQVFTLGKLAFTPMISVVGCR